ncbi:unnamed protein product, partial [marine sediment metagenome]
RCGLFLDDHIKAEHSLVSDVSWAEVKAFLEKDTTEDNEYIEGVYVCKHFVRDVINNAEAAGIRAGYVVVKFEDGTQHALICFNTTDRGLVFVESQGSDRIIFMEVGGNYIFNLWGLEDRESKMSIMRPGIISSIDIDWGN